jgi:hypothetical protein
VIKYLVRSLLLMSALALLAGVWHGSWQWIATAIVVFTASAGISGAAKREHTDPGAADRLAELAAHPEQFGAPLSVREHPAWPTLAQEVLWQASLAFDDDPARTDARIRAYGLAKDRA